MQRQLRIATFLYQRRLIRPYPQRCPYSSTPKTEKELQNIAEIEEYLSKPSWSVKSLLPTEQQVNESTEVTTDQLHHLLRLSALSLPSTPEEEAAMLRDLRAQLHFVKEIQKVDTDGIEPMTTIRAESTASQDAEAISLGTVRAALDHEETVGTYHKRIRRRQATSPKAAQSEDWDVLGQAPKKVGRFFVVHATES